jgi:hypothetical protein
MLREAVAVVRGAAILPLLLAAACALWEDPLPVAITVSVAPATLPQGDTARVTLEIRNLGIEDVQVSLSGCNTDFWLRDGWGRLYYPAEQVFCPLALLPPRTLRRGEVLRIQNFSTGLVVQAGSAGPATLLPPGSYRVETAVRVSGGSQSELVTGSWSVLTLLPR